MPDYVFASSSDFLEDGCPCEVARQPVETAALEVPVLAFFSLDGAKIAVFSLYTKLSYLSPGYISY